MSVSITFTIPGNDDALAFKKKIREIAESQGVSMSEWIVNAIAERMRHDSRA